MSVGDKSPLGPFEAECRPDHDITGTHCRCRGAHRSRRIIGGRGVGRAFLAVPVGVHQTARVRRWIWGLMAVVVTVVVATATAATRLVLFTKTPPKQTNNTSAHFEWTGRGPSSARSTVRLRDLYLAQGLHGLSEGPHKFSVQGGTGATAPPPVEYDWTVDLTSPTTVVTQKPPALSNSTTATFEFNSPDITATFQCSLNGSPAQTCTSPVTYTGLADATRTLLIQAVDPAGNVDTQAQPIAWTVDTTPPDTVLADPGNIVGNLAPQFTFTSSEMNSHLPVLLRRRAVCGVHRTGSRPRCFTRGRTPLQRPRGGRGGERRPDAGSGTRGRAT